MNLQEYFVELAKIEKMGEVLYQGLQKPVVNG
jgi:hypothetical protein